MNKKMIVAGLCGGCLMVGMSAHADVSPTNETNAAEIAFPTNGTNAVATAVDETTVLSVEEEVRLMLQEFAKKKGDGFKYGVVNEKTDEIYYAAISPAFSLGTNDTIATVSQMAFNRAFTGILLRRAMATFAYSASFDSSDGGVAGGIITVIGDETRSGVQRADFPVPGMSVVKTCLAVSEGGNLAVGVIVKADLPRDEVARCAAEGVRPSVPRKEGIPYKKLLEIPGDRLALSFGTAFYYNENGEPELMSFGRWGLNVPSSMSRAECEAKAFAHAEAEAQDSLSTFLTGVVQFRSTSELTAFGKDLTAQQFMSWTLSSRVSLKGVQTVVRKVLRLSTGEEVAFVAIRLPVWSFPEEKPEQKTAPAKATTTDKQYDF